MSYLTPSGQTWRMAALLGFMLGSAQLSPATILDTIGVTLLRATTTNLYGTGVRVAQVEASSSTNVMDFQVSPTDNRVNQSSGLFTYISPWGTASNAFPNAVGAYSFHATEVAKYFFGLTNGVATNVAHADNYDAQHFFDNYIDPVFPPNPNAPIINQSFTFGPQSLAFQQYLDSHYDNSAAQHGILFISGVGHGNSVSAPATCYNGIGVGAFGGASNVGPTTDNGRSKPDIVAPESVTSYATPQVSGAAAVLRQAARRGDGGSDTNAASDLRTVKALLLNGAIKPAGWTNGNSTPLDARHGVGILNVFNSYRQLTGGRHPFTEQTSVGLLANHPPGPSLVNISNWSGWAYETVSSTVTQDQINHYYFEITNGVDHAAFTLSATLVWNRQLGQTNINDLDLFLVNVANSNVVAESISFVNNVEHLFVRALPPGRYDLQVLKYGGPPVEGNVTTNETYALAWEFFALPLAIAQSGTNVILNWPIYPTGFTLEATTNQTAPFNWSAVAATPTVTNGTNFVTLGTTNITQLFRLRRP